MFEHAHRLITQLLREGALDGLRIDHVDGLLDPAEYLARVREAVDAFARAECWDASATSQRSKPGPGVILCPWDRVLLGEPYGTQHGAFNAAANISDLGTRL